MLIHILKTTLRVLVKNKLYSFVNILGLSIGITCTTLILLFVMHETSYDEFHENSQLLYRINEIQVSETSGERIHHATSHTPLADAVRLDIPEIEEIVRLYKVPSLLGNASNQKFLEDNFFYADSNIFSLFSFEFISKESGAPLNDPFTVVLTEDASRKYFNTTEAVGKTLILEKEHPLKVTAVVKSFPSNSHFHFDFICSYSTVLKLESHINNWYYPSVHVYSKLKSGTSPQAVENKLNTLHAKYIPWEDELRDFSLQKVTDIHLTSNMENELSQNSDERYVLAFFLIAGFIILIASINFINISTARAEKRAKEVGIKKVVGLGRKRITFQFLFESIIFVFFSFVFSILLTELALPFFNDLTGKQLSLNYLSVEYLCYFGIIVFLVGSLAGIYPALVLSSFNPVRVLKGKGFENVKSGLIFRRVLVGFQFFLSALLILTTLFIYNQIEFIQNKKLGYEKESIVVVELRESKDQQNYETLKNRLEQYSTVISASASSGVPSREGIHGFHIYPQRASFDSTSVKVLSVDHDFVETYGIEIIAGRDFDRSFQSDADNGFLINESAARLLGWEEPVGQNLRLQFYTDYEENKDGKVVGVVKDFNYRSLHHKVEPVLFHMAEHQYYTDFLSVRFSPGNIESNINLLKSEWASFNPQSPIKYFFLDESIDRLYQSEKHLSKIILFFTSFAIFVALLGLFGLTTFTIQNRIKEIGIRKVLGASIPSLLILFAREILLLVLIGNLLAVPASILFIEDWLSDFAYRIDVSLLPFLITFGATVAFSMIIMSYQSLKASLISPAASIRQE